MDLKLYIESTIVENFLDTSNAAEFLLLGDSHFCPLLKEASMNIYNNDANAVMESEKWCYVEESSRLLSELLKFCKVGKQISSDEDSVNFVTENLDVTSLRNRLLEANLDIDGNKEILIGRLKNYILSSTNSNDSSVSSDDD